MNTKLRILVPLLLPLALAAQRPWQQITVPSVREAATHFRTPPHEYGAIHWAIWSGELTRERIVREFDALVANGIFVVNLGPARGMNPKYFSPEHLALIKFAVEEASKRGMKVWLADEGSYPSGFAGGKISTDYPQLAMQGIVADVRISAAPGQTISMPAPPDTMGALAVNPGAGTAEPLALRGGRIQWTAPPDGRREILLVRHVFRSSPTRYINRADGTYSKDSLYSLIDYLNPEATRAFLKTTHEVYKELFGNQFGETVLGFFGDEPDYTGFIPWTPALLENFQAQKGYDLQPYLPSFFAPKMTEEAWRAKADYWDVWSGIFRNSFFGVQADWCAKNNLEYLVHLNHEELMLNLSRGEDLIRNEGDFFRDMRFVQVPGIDNLNQLRLDAVNREDTTYAVNNNFPKLASSAAHLFGRPRVWTEGGGGTGVDGKFQLDYQLVRGVNAPQIRIPAIRASGTSEEALPQAAMLAWYTNRASYLMAIGRPAAQVALYHPANSMWMGDEQADRSTTKLGKQLLEQQIDFDYFDEQSLGSVATLENGAFRNLSGQVYRAVIVPSSTVISRVALDRLRAMAAAGGKVIFAGVAPTIVVDRSFLQAKEKPDLSFATLLEPAGDITPRVVAALPKPDIALDSPCPALKYTHRSWRDADLYFFFNESDKPQSRTVEVSGHGQPQVWDAGTGDIHLMTGGAAGKDSLRLPLVLEPYEAKFVVIGAVPQTVGAPEPSFAAGETIADFPIDAPVTQFQKQITLASKPAGKRFYVECTDVHDYARLRVNSKDLAARAWQPYRWDVTDALIAGANLIEIEVRTLPPGGRAEPAGTMTGTRQGGAQPAGGRGPVAPPPVPGVAGAIRLVARGQ